MRFLSWTRLLLVVVASVGAVKEEEEKVCSEGNRSCLADNKNTNNHHQCGLYLAPSTIPNAGLGIFVAQEHHPGDIIGYGDLAIPLVDMELHLGTKHFFSPFDDYRWRGEVMGMSMESENQQGGVSAYCPGLDCAINCNLALINVDKSLPVWDEAGLNRTSPGVGSITPYHNGSTKVIEYIPPGGELFKFYGDRWFETRNHAFGMIPLRQDHIEAERICKRFADLKMSDGAQEELWTIIKSFRWNTRLTNAFPASVNLVRQAATHKDGIRSLYQPAGQRSVSELEATGRCLDNIKHGKSTLGPDAGRGAFATRDMPAGAIITGSPLLQLPEKDEFVTMYELEHDSKTNKTKRILQQQVGKQLVTNYCFSHPATSIALCPYGVGINYINHNQTLANVKIQWSKQGEIAHDGLKWFKVYPYQMDVENIKVSFDYIATKDIKAGDELFLDYGNEWEQAWQQHVANWKPPKDAKHYLAAGLWNNKEFANAPIRTERECQWDPYPSNVVITCHTIMRKKKWLEVIRNRTATNELWDINEKGFPCKILRRYENIEGETVYDVKVDIHDFETTKYKFTLERVGVPRSGMTFVDRPYSTDFQQRGVFRHWLGIPDDMLPDAWRNVE